MIPTPEMLDRVKEVIGLVRGPLAPGRTDSDSSLRGDLAMDTLHLQTIACELDEAFGIEIPDKAIADWETPADIALTAQRLTARERNRT